MFGNVSARKDSALELINYWDSIEKLRPLFEEDKISQRNAKDEYSHLAILEETSWRQKSRALWLKEGDNNTEIFHRMANARRNGNFISSLTISGIRLEKEEELKEGIFSHFREMFKEPQVRRPDMATELFKSIDSTDRGLRGPFFGGGSDLSSSRFGR